MLAIYDDRQGAHKPLTRMFGGRLVDTPERPERVDMLLAGLATAGCNVCQPDDHGPAAIAAVHDPDYLDFLENGFAQWNKSPSNGPEVRASVHPNIYMNRKPRDLLGRAGYYQADASSVLVEGTWKAAQASANTAVDGMKRVLGGENAIYALCRPPGHHAYADKAGGFCYLNNTAIAAQVAASAGSRVAIIDVDVHHGNGTQALFYDRPDIFTASVHGDPAHLYPYYAGYADEIGVGAGEGANLNIPVALMSSSDAYLGAVSRACEAAAAFQPDTLIVALGLDASAQDPFACMNVDIAGFHRMGERLANLRLPTLIVQEGGYPSPALPDCLAAFLSGFTG